MKCQQVFRTSRKKDSTEVKIFPKVLGGATFFETPVGVICREGDLRVSPAFWSKIQHPHLEAVIKKRQRKCYNNASLHK